MTLWQLCHPPVCVNGKVGNCVGGVRNKPPHIHIYQRFAFHTHPPATTATTATSRF